jgi:hypothetical protein
VRLVKECAQSHQGALDRTRAKACTVCGGTFLRTRSATGVRLSVQQCALDSTCARVCVRKLGLWARANVCGLECRPVSGIECTRLQSAEILNKNKNKNKAKI